jgi:phosphoribosylanthranilate isomerase
VTPLIKICGLNTAAAVDAARTAGATHGGFMFFGKSPRNVSLDEARTLGAQTGALAKVAVMVDPDDALIATVMAALAPEMLQLHGDETPARVAEVARMTNKPVIKALGVSSAADIAVARDYSAAAMILFDAKPPKDATRPGGLGAPFDWDLLKGLDLPVPWILSGGLDAATVAAAIRKTGAGGVDVSSGVEDAPGVKSPARIAAFTAAARAALGLPVLDTAA